MTASAVVGGWQRGSARNQVRCRRAYRQVRCAMVAARSSSSASPSRTANASAYPIA